MKKEEAQIIIAFYTLQKYWYAQGIFFDVENMPSEIRSMCKHLIYRLHGKRL